MKISRKMKKFFVTFLAATLSIIMFATQVSAWDVVSYYEDFEEEEDILSAREAIVWDITRDKLVFAIDVECYEHDDVDYVLVSLDLTASYYLWATDTLYFDSVYLNDNRELTYLNTWDSDEVTVMISNFERTGIFDKIEIDAYVRYEINYNNGDKESYEYRHVAVLLDGEDFSWNRNHTAHVYIYPVD